MKYTAPEMEMKALDVEDIIMSGAVVEPDPKPGELPDDDF